MRADRAHGGIPGLPIGPGRAEVAGKKPMRRGPMITVVVGKAPDHRGPVHDPGMKGHLVADPKAWKAGRNRPVGTSIFPRRIGLHVEGIQLRWSAVLPYENHRTLASARRPGAFSPEELRQGETEGAQGAGGDELTPAEAVAETPG